MKPLEGITVLELSTMITASFAAMMMAEQGAHVIKIEPLDEGDPMRYLGTSKGGISGLFINCNRGKQSIRVDLKNAEGQQVVKDLAATADVLLCNFRPGVMDALNLGSDALRAANDRLIYTAISGFGPIGPERNTPAYDPIIQAQAGFAAVQGEGHTAPQFVRNLTCDKVTAYTACQAVTAALYMREKTGTGQHIDLSMMDAGLYFLFPDGFMHHTLLDDDAIHVPPLSQMLYDLTETSDGAITMSAGTDKQRIGLLMAVDQVGLMADERFNTQEKLLANLLEFREILAGVFRSYTSDELLARLSEQDVPAAKCLSYEEVLNHPQYAATASMDVAEHPAAGNIRRVKPPAQFAGERLPSAGHAPEHGADTEAILKTLGRSASEIEQLQAAGVIAL